MPANTRNRGKGGKRGRKGRQVGILSQFGTRGQLEAALSEYSAKMREAAAARDKAAAEMKAAAEDGREEAFDEAKEKY